MHTTFTKNGIKKEVKNGFSWTVFLFGWIALLIRKQPVPAIICFLTFGLAGFYFMFTANKMLAIDLVEQGWVTTDSIEWVNQ